MHAAEVHVALLVEQAPRLARLGLPDNSLANVVGGGQIQRALPAQGEGGVACEPFPDLVEFQHAQRSCVHVGEYSTPARSGAIF